MTPVTFIESVFSGRIWIPGANWPTRCTRNRLSWGEGKDKLAPTVTLLSYIQKEVYHAAFTSLPRAIEVFLDLVEEEETKEILVILGQQDQW